MRANWKSIERQWPTNRRTPTSVDTENNKEVVWLNFVHMPFTIIRHKVV